MLARISGGNEGIGYYLEHGNKQGREYSRDELDKRLILDGDLSLTESVINAIPDNGQERYLHITLSFYENEVSEQILHDIVHEYKSLLMNAYHDEEYCFYAESHLPKIKNITDNRTGESIERKPHIHIVIPEINLVNGKKLNPTGKVENYYPQLDAIQEYLNYKYNLVSPKDGVRVSDQNHANVLSRTKGDLFKERHADIKREIYSLLDKENIHSDVDFEKILSRYGEVKEYNKGKENRYFGVKLDGEAKFTRLKSPLFSKQYISERAIPLVKPTPKQIESHLKEWVESTSHEIKHIHPSGEKTRKTYASLTGEHKINYLQKVIKNYDEKHNLQREDRRQANHQPRSQRNTGKPSSVKAVGLSRLSERNLVYGLHGRSGRGTGNKSELLLPADEYRDLSTARRKEIDTDRYVRRLQDRTRGRVIHSPVESEIKKALYDVNDLPLLKKIRTEIDTERFLSHLHSRFNIDPSQYTVSFSKDGSPRFRAGSRNMNASDFLTKHLNLEWTEAKAHLLDIWQDQIENKPFTQIHTRVSLTKEQARERFSFLNEHKKWVNQQIKQQFIYNMDEYKRNLHDLLSIRDKHEMEVERGFIVFKKMEKENTIKAVRQSCFYEINAYFNHWQPNRGNDMALGDALKKIIKNPVEGNRISSGATLEQYSVAKRVQKEQLVAEYVKRELTDLVPHKVNPKEVRYLDPQTTQTVFVDKGEHIRISGEVTQDKTEAMLLYSKEKYGGVLRLNGSEEFKTACAMAAAEKGMNIIFKPEKYHEMMQARVAELQAENALNQENTLHKAERHAEPEQAKPENQSERTPEQEKIVQDATPQPEARQTNVVNYDFSVANRATELNVSLLREGANNEFGYLKGLKADGEVTYEVLGHAPDDNKDVFSVAHFVNESDAKEFTRIINEFGIEKAERLITNQLEQNVIDASDVTLQHSPVDDLKDEAENLVIQQREAQRLLDDAEKNDYPKEEIQVLAKGVNAVTSRLKVVSEQIKQVEAELQQKAETVQAKSKDEERSLDGELNKLSTKLAAELKIDKSIVRQSLEFAKFKDVHDLDNCMSSPERGLKVNDVKNHVSEIIE